jgi:hypothetical protein
MLFRANPRGLDAANDCDPSERGAADAGPVTSTRAGLDEDWEDIGAAVLAGRVSMSMP